MIRPLRQLRVSQVVVDLLLRASTVRPRVRMETLDREAYTEAALRALHAMATRLMAEEYEHFRVHAYANDVAHVFRRVDTGEVVGFQFWRTAELQRPRARIILGGKLRVLPEFRNHALHLLSGLVFYAQNQLRRPRTRFYRLSIASIFGFVSITEALADYRLFDPHERGAEADAIRAAFVRLAAESHFVPNERGWFHVGIVPTPATLGRYSPRYFEKPAARIYALANPEFRTNGYNLGFWFRFTPANLGALVRTIGRKLWARSLRDRVDAGSRS